MVLSKKKEIKAMEKRKLKRNARSVASKKITEKEIKTFYKKLSMFPSFYLPAGEFKIFDQVEVKETANSGV